MPYVDHRRAALVACSVAWLWSDIATSVEFKRMEFGVSVIARDVEVDGSGWLTQTRNLMAPCIYTIGRSPSPRCFRGFRGADDAMLSKEEDRSFCGSAEGLQPETRPRSSSGQPIPCPLSSLPGLPPRSRPSRSSCRSVDAVRPDVASISSLLRLI